MQYANLCARRVDVTGIVDDVVGGGEALRARRLGGEHPLDLVGVLGIARQQPFSLQLDGAIDHEHPIGDICEAGLDEEWKPGGRIKRLEDRDGDGRFEDATVFLDGLPFPTGVMAWRDGVLVCAAPEILFARDTDGDGRADERRTILDGFHTSNYQARVNGLSWGLDNRVHGANGLPAAVPGDHHAVARRGLRPDVRHDEDRPPGAHRGRVRHPGGGRAVVVVLLADDDEVGVARVRPPT